MSADDFFEGILDDVFEQLADDLHGKAASVVDPQTGKHAPVFVRSIGNESWTIHTSGSPAFARAVEQRLGLNKGEVHAMNEPAKRERLVYVAHAHEDKSIVEPLAEGLMQRGINVWYDTWEIGYGDSLRRKMEEGLGSCTHFIVLLTETSIMKSWVNEEIDAGLMSAVEGSAKFIGLRHNLPLAAVSPFLKTRLTPEFKLDEGGLNTLAGEIQGISKKPLLGESPQYVQSHSPGSTWSAAARVIAEYFVRNSPNGRPMEPQATYTELQEATGLPTPDVRIGVLDLIGAGLLEKRDYLGGDAIIWPKSDLFATFDSDFMGWQPEKDARDLAVHLINLDTEQVQTDNMYQALGWEPRRFSAAAAYLVSARVVKPIEWMDAAECWPHGFIMGDELLRFVRSF
ncbi:toll/interleukin-1 receptor domain-containing protein [Dyella jejuensis]|uniref:Toll/interleukin-1 receptor domain-containing protein n=1 Tax=Dyella jejuensis TaxID=1432009 RepID=A0ABW8JL85_9GAMM